MLRYILEEFGDYEANETLKRLRAGKINSVSRNTMEGVS